MSEFYHHPDGLIRIAGLEMPLDQFLIDVPGYSLPAGIIGRHYIPNKRHFLYDGKSQFNGGLDKDTKLWSEGDAYIANAQTYYDNYKARTAPPPPTLDELKTAGKQKVDIAAESYRLKYITQGSGQALVYERKRAEALAIKVIAESGTPVAADYPLADERATRKTLTLEQVADEWLLKANAWLVVATQIEGLRETAKEAIDAVVAGATTDDDIAAIDAIVTGIVWPTP